MVGSTPGKGGAVGVLGVACGSAYEGGYSVFGAVESLRLLVFDRIPCVPSAELLNNILIGLFDTLTKVLEWAFARALTVKEIELNYPVVLLELFHRVSGLKCYLIL